MDTKTLIIGILALLLLLIGAWFFTQRTVTPVSISKNPIASFEECMHAGYAVTTDTPRQCRTPEGKIFLEEVLVQNTYINASTKDIVVDAPRAGATTSKVITVQGKARGTWYFEASFPLVLLDSNGSVLASGVGRAEGDWMTEEFVSFTASIKVPSTYTGKATLVLKKDNPSGMPERDASVTIPVTIQ